MSAKFSYIIKWISHSVLAAMVGIFIYSLLKHEVNLPNNFDDLIIFIYYFDAQFLGVETLLEKITYFFKMGNWPHPKLIGRLYGAIDYGLTGEVNLRRIALFGNLSLLGFFALIYWDFKKKPWILIPVALILFTISENNFWPVLVTGMYSFLFFSYLSFWAKDRGNEYLALISSFIATFTFGLGGIAFAINTFHTIINFFKGKSNNKLVSIWVIALAITTLLFFGISLDGFGGDTIDQVAHKIPTSSDSKMSPWSFLMLLGAPIHEFISLSKKDLHYSRIVGTIVLSITLTLIAWYKDHIPGRYKKMLITFLVICFLAGVSHRVAVDHTVWNFAPRRYFMFPLMIWLFSMLSIGTILSNRIKMQIPILALFSLMAFGLWQHSYAQIPAVTKKKEQIATLSILKERPRARKHSEKLKSIDRFIKTTQFQPDLTHLLKVDEDLELISLGQFREQQLNVRKVELANETVYSVQLAYDVIEPINIDYIDYCEKIGLRNLYCGPVLQEEIEIKLERKDRRRNKMHLLTFRVGRRTSNRMTRRYLSIQSCDNEVLLVELDLLGRIK